MTEETTNNEQEGEEEKPSSENTGDGNKPAELSVVEQANATLKKLEAENDRREKLIAEEKLQRQMGGLAEAGIAPEPPKEETPLEYKNRIMSGR